MPSPRTLSHRVPSALRPMAWAGTLLCCAALSACGGGDTGATPSSVDTSGADSATATEAPTDTASAMDVAMQTTQAVVATSTSGTAIACPGGGTASYTVTGGADDGQLQTGETYQISFDSCKGTAQAAAVSGSATLTITALTTTHMGATVTFTQLSAVLPLSTVTLQGSASAGTGIVYTRSQSGPTLSTSATLSATGLSVTRTTASRTVQYSLDSLSLTRSTQTASDGTVTSSSMTGQATVSSSRPAGNFSATLALQSAVSFSGGVPVSGQWTVTLPASALTVSASASAITVAVDLGKDGSTDRSRTFVPGTWADSAE